MARFTDVRRRSVIATAGGLGAGLAGCLGLTDSDEDSETNDSSGSDDDDESDDQDGEDEEASIEELREPSLTVHLENEDGEPVSSGVVVTIEAEDEPLTYQHAEIEDGEVTQEEMDAGEYTVTAESEDDSFDPVEESVTIDEDDVEVTLVLEGAAGDE